MRIVAGQVRGTGPSLFSKDRIYTPDSKLSLLKTDFGWKLRLMEIVTEGAFVRITP